MNDSVTRTLIAVQNGQENSAESIAPIVYEKLRKLAGHYLSKERSPLALQPTELVSEAYIALVNIERVDWKGQTHFCAVAANCMRRILVDQARRRNAVRRGADARSLTLNTALLADHRPAADALELEDALARLESVSPRGVRIVELRFYGGLTESQTAEALKISERTVRREWIAARAWLHRELYPGDEEPSARA